MTIWSKRTCATLVFATILSLGFAKETSGTADTSTTAGAHPATVAGKKAGARFMELHEKFLKRGKEGPIGVLFLGDSITERWTSAPKVWNKYFDKWNPANFGIGGDRTQHVLWRIENGELDGISPKVLVLMIGTNNANSDPPEDITQGITNIVKEIRAKLPQTKILLLGIFPRGFRVKEGTKPMDTINKVNPEIAKLDDGKMIRYKDIGNDLTLGGEVTKEIMPDMVHLSEEGYERWAKAITPTVEEMLK